MNETQRNIQAYKDALPGLKERVIAVALLLVMSAAMMTSATFAWITLSRAPEVSNVNTTVAANGNLEIALVKPDGSVPGESAVGDSSAAEGNTITNANVTWGNLVNLSDISYGLDKIVLRPALLGNPNNLLKQPLRGVDYGKDGRLEQYYNENYQFTNWFIPPSGEGYFAFSETPQYGVRAISTVEYEYTNNTYYQFSQLMKNANEMQQAVEAGYSGPNGLTNNRTYLDALAAMIGTFMTDNLNDTDSDVSNYIKPLYNMLIDMYELLVGTGNPDDKCFEDALVALANTMVYSKYATSENPEAYIPYLYTRETLFKATAKELADRGVKLDGLDDYQKLREGIEEVLYGTGKESGEYDENGELILIDDCIYDFYVRIYPHKTDDGKVDETRKDSTKTLMMTELKPFINKMVHIDTCKLLLRDGRSYQVNQIGMKVATSIMNDLDPCDAQIQKGLLVDFETLTGAKMCATDVKVKASYSVFSITATAETITTTAPDESLFDKDVAYSEELASANKEYTAMAQDTYGMALDFWLRTNIAGGYLVLEGNVLTEKLEEPELGIDKNGNETNLYTVTVSTTVTSEDGTQSEMKNDAAVYKLTEDGKEVWYYADNHALLYNEDGTEPEGQTISEPIPRIKVTYPVIGYEGENRIWQDNALMDVTSTTQGNGSCYVFYADDPGQQTNSLRLLSNLRVAFIDNTPNSATNGKLIAIGKLDIENRYEDSGKVTLPLVLYNDGSSYLTKMEEGLAILSMPQNDAIRLTAVVYLDGREITNADVLAANDIQGQLNIQFGSTVEMQPIDDEPLQLATRSVSAVIKKAGTGEYPANNNGPTYDDNGRLNSDPDVTFSFDEATEANPMKVNVRVKVSGDRANNVTAFFMRKVNDTQGSRENEFTLNESETEPGIYEGEFTFTVPGEYVMRTVRLDGVDYSLPATDYPRVAISGYTIQDIQMFYNGERLDSYKSIMTDKQSVTTDLELQFATSKKYPNSIKMQFEKDDGTLVTTSLNYNSTDQKWRGNVTFTSSGKYTLKYVIIDGEYAPELDLRFKKELDLKLGLTVSVIDGGDYRSGIFLSETINVPMYVEIYDNNGEEIKYLSDARLVYQRNGSNITSEKLDLKWNTSEDCYTCQVPISRPGRYSFSCVILGTNTLTNTVNTPPVFTWTSPIPPSYYDAKPMESMDDYMLSTGPSGITVGVRLLDAEAASVAPVFYDADTGNIVTGAFVASGNDETVTVDGESKTASTFIFQLPSNGSYQSGDWTLLGLKLAGVYDSNSVEYTAESPMVWEFVRSTDQVQTVEEGAWNANAQKIVTDEDMHVQVVNVRVQLSGDCEDEDLDGGSFMGTATATKPVKVIISDHKGRTLNSQYVTISDLNLNYIYVPNSSETYGHYLGSNDGGVAPVTTDKYTVSGTEYSFNKLTFGYAGQYVGGELAFTVSSASSSQAYIYTSNEYKDTHKNETGVLDLPVYTLSTAAPTATISAITPTGSNATKITYTTKDVAWYLGGGTQPTFTATGAMTSSFDKNTNQATLYAVATADNSTQRHGGFTQPTLTLTVAGVDSGCEVTLTLPGGSADAITFSRTGNGTIKKTLGKVSQIKSWTSNVALTHTLSAYYGHGEQTISTMQVVKDNVTYTVTLPTSIKINNPSSVNQS